MSIYNIDGLRVDSEEAKKILSSFFEKAAKKFKAKVEEGIREEREYVDFEAKSPYNLFLGRKTKVIDAFLSNRVKGATDLIESCDGFKEFNSICNRENLKFSIIPFKWEIASPDPRDPDAEYPARIRVSLN